MTGYIAEIFLKSDEFVLQYPNFSGSGVNPHLKDHTKVNLNKGTN